MWKGFPAEQHSFVNPSDSYLSNEGEANMNAAKVHRFTRVKPKRKLAVILAVSAPIIFWLISLFSYLGIGKENYHVQ
jgi:hypothetical protein